MRFFDHALETMPSKAIKVLQIEKLRSMLKKIYGHNRFYTDKFETAGIDPVSYTHLTLPTPPYV